MYVHVPTNQFNLYSECVYLATVNAYVYDKTMECAKCLQNVPHKLYYSLCIVYVNSKYYQKGIHGCPHFYADYRTDIELEIWGVIVQVHMRTHIHLSILWLYHFYFSSPNIWLKDLNKINSICTPIESVNDVVRTTLCFRA